MHWKNGRWLLVAAILVLAGGCHLIVGIRDAEPYPPDAGAGGATACTPNQMQVCYRGPEQTDGVGVCRGGTQACTSDGEWGACEGEALPGTEDCSAPEDEDCNGYACSETLWVKQFGVQSTSASPADVAVDPQTGDIYVTGSFSGVLPTGPDTLDVQSANSAAFLAKFDSQGTVLWAKQFAAASGSYSIYGFSLVIDTQSNVVLSGVATPAVNLGGSDLPEGVFIGKFSPSGEYLWSQACQADYDWGLSAYVAVDPSSNDVVVAGTFAAFAPGTITCGNIAVMGTADVFVAKLAAADGTALFLKEFGDAGVDLAYDVEVDGQGSILLTGAGNDVSFGGLPLTGGYIAKLASNGSHAWSKGIGEGSLGDLEIDAAGDVAVTGTGTDTGSLNFGGEDLLPIGSRDLFVARLKGSGDHVWSRRFGSPGENLSGGGDLAVDHKGNLAVSGSIKGNVIIDGAILTGDSTPFIMTFDIDGKGVWSRTFGGGSFLSQTIAFSSLDELAVAGNFRLPADFGKGLATPVGESDLFLLKIAP